MIVDQRALPVGSKAQAQIVRAGQSAFDEGPNQAAGTLVVVLMNTRAVDGAVHFQRPLPSAPLRDRELDCVALGCACVNPPSDRFGFTLRLEFTHFRAHLRSHTMTVCFPIWFQVAEKLTPPRERHLPPDFIGDGPQGIHGHAPAAVLV